MKNSLKTASVLAFEKKLANSDALMFSGNGKIRIILMRFGSRSKFRKKQYVGRFPID